MQKQNRRRFQASGISSRLTAGNFFIENNPNGVVSCTPFLDLYDPMERDNPQLFQKHEMMWDCFKEGKQIDGFLKKRNDKRSGSPYVWLEIQIGRGILPCRFDLLSDQSFEFIIKLQKAVISIDCTLRELIDEANRLESVPGTNFTYPDKFPYESKQFNRPESAKDSKDDDQSESSDN